MKLVKGFGLLSFLAFITGACFDAPQFPSSPQIEYAGLEFIDSPNPGEFDSLILTLTFKDGDGDLGLSRQDPRHLSDPFHFAYFYQENNGQVEPIATQSGYIDQYEFELLLIPDASKGKLVTYRTRKKPGYEFLPPGDKCGGSSELKYYEYLGAPIGDGDPNAATGRRLLIRAQDRAVIEEKFQLVDSFPRSSPEYYQIRDTLYYTRNPNHNTIEVDFLVKDPSAPGGFREFDWAEEYCTTFDGRFVVLSEPDNSLEGSIRYTMTSIGFNVIFSLKTLKLRVKIRDRALNESNVIETPEFSM